MKIRISILLFTGLAFFWICGVFLIVGCLVVDSRNAGGSLSRFGWLFYDRIPVWLALNLTVLAGLLLNFLARRSPFDVAVSQWLAILASILLAFLVCFPLIEGLAVRAVFRGIALPFREVFAATLSTMAVVIACGVAYRSRSPWAPGAFLAVPLAHVVFLAVRWNAEVVAFELGLPSLFPTPQVIVFLLPGFVIIAALALFGSKQVGIPPEPRSACWFVGLAGLCVTYFLFFVVAGAYILVNSERSDSNDSPWIVGITAAFVLGNAGLVWAAWRKKSSD